MAAAHKALPIQQLHAKFRVMYAPNDHLCLWGETSKKPHSVEQETGIIHLFVVDAENYLTLLLARQLPTHNVNTNWGVPPHCIFPLHEPRCFGSATLVYFICFLFRLPQVLVVAYKYIIRQAQKHTKLIFVKKICNKGNQFTNKCQEISSRKWATTEVVHTCSKVNTHFTWWIYSLRKPETVLCTSCLITKHLEEQIDFSPSVRPISPERDF